ncbi:MAG: dipeptidase [Lachnospiraceae bacterium]|nr:dipeptidase [Lachnospiraceae bacterium]
MKHQYNYYNQAEQLHQQVPVVDCHNDLAGELLLRHQKGETHVIQRLYLPNWKAAGFQLIVSSIYIENAVFFPKTPASGYSDKKQPDHDNPKDWNYYWKQHQLCWEQGFANALAQIDAITQEIHELPDELCLVTTTEDISQIKQGGKIGILLYMEGLDCIGTDLSRLHTLYRLGIRGASLTWSRPNLLATGCCTATKHQDIPGSITPLGEQVIRMLQKHSMFLDISHLNNEGWNQVNQLYSNEKKMGSKWIPYIATHSNSYEIYPNYRNLTDPQMTALANQGGIMGLNACKYIVGSQNPADYLDSMCNHIEYMVTLVGAEHVGFGFDLCDSYSKGKYQTETIDREDCLQNHKEALLLTARLLERGMSEQNVLRIIGLNWLEYFEYLLSQAL